jgi:hypothetical protein
MKLQRLASAMLFLMLAELLSVTGGEVLHTEAIGDRASHTDGAPRPVPADDRHPYDHDCSCTCCPGCAVGLAFVAQSSSFRIAPPIAFKVHYQNDLLSKDVVQSIFRPPRA